MGDVFLLGLLPMCRDSDVIPTATNEAYHTVRHPRETVAAYAIVTIPCTVPSHS